MAERGSDVGFDVVCLSHLRWGFVFQRPQHLLTRCAESRRVFFVEEAVASDGEPRLEIRHERTNLWVATPHLPAGLSDTDTADAVAELLDTLLLDANVERFVLWFYTPAAVPFARHLRPVATVYDCMDELSAFAGAAKTLREREGELFDSADLVFTGGPSLYDAKRERHPSVHLFPSAVDVEHFATARSGLREPADQRDLPRPRVGFFGVIDERMDLDLLGEAARLRPDWQWILVGPVVKIPEESLPQAPNIHYLGQRGYRELPSYLAGWDAAILPFARNEATRFISPTKTPEYLAAGAPVVSTSVNDVVRMWGSSGLVYVADRPAEFVEALERAMREPRAERLERVDEALQGISWDRTWARMERLIRDVVTRRLRMDASDAAAARGPGHDGASAPTSDGAGRHGGGAHDGRGENGSPVRVGAEPMPVRPRADGFDYLVVGAGFAGAIVAERLASQGGKRILVVDRRTHIGGNAYDVHDDAGILIHRYGPHIFHTNALEVVDYLSNFTEWRPYEHRVLAAVDGSLLPIPINLDTINGLYGMQLDSAGLQRFFDERREPCDHPKSSEDVVVSAVGRELYEKFFRGYTRKHWGLDPSELDASVTARVPTRTNRDPRYFTDTYQVMPAHGYTRMFERILDHPNIKVMLNTDYREVAGLVPYAEVVFTGPIDEFFEHRYGALPYRSLEFRFETHDRERFQEAPVVNYPNHQQFTRITEFKYLTGQVHPKTTVVYEYARSEGDPYYPIPMPQNATLYRRYKEIAGAAAGVHFIGRLGTYKYYNMDQVAAQALAVARRLIAGSARAEDDLGGAILSPARDLGRHRMHA